MRAPGEGSRWTVCGWCDRCSAWSYATAKHCDVEDTMFDVWLCPSCTSLLKVVA